jgi:hypothetical protein
VLGEGREREERNMVSARFLSLLRWADYIARYSLLRSVLENRLEEVCGTGKRASQLCIPANAWPNARDGRRDALSFSFRSRPRSFILTVVGRISIVKLVEKDGVGWKRPARRDERNDGKGELDATIRAMTSDE